MLPTRKLFVPLTAIEDGLALRSTFTTFDFVEGQDAFVEGQDASRPCKTEQAPFAWLSTFTTFDFVEGQDASR